VARKVPSFSIELVLFGFLSNLKLAFWPIKRPGSYAINELEITSPVTKETKRALMKVPLIK